MDAGNLLKPMLARNEQNNWNKNNHAHFEEERDTHDKGAKSHCPCELVLWSGLKNRVHDNVRTARAGEQNTDDAAQCNKQAYAGDRAAHTGGEAVEAFVVRNARDHSGGCGADEQ